VKKAFRITIWIFILLVFVGSAAAFYVFHSNIWKNASVDFINNQLSASFNLELTIRELHGSPFGNLQFKHLRLITDKQNDIAEIGEINLRYGLLPFIFNKGEIKYLGIDSLQLSYPGSIDTLKKYLSGKTDTGSGREFNLQKIELTNLLLSDNKRDLIRTDFIQGSCSISSDSISLFIDDANIGFDVINEDFIFKNASITLISDSLVIHDCHIENRSTKMGIAGYVLLDSTFVMDLVCNVENLNFLERLPDQHRLFLDDDYLNIEGRITARNQLVFTDFNFNGKFKDNRVTGGTLIGNFDNRDFNFSEFSFRSGNQKMQSSISGNIESGLSADIIIDQIDFSQWQLMKTHTQLNGLISLDVTGNILNPDSVFADVALNEVRFDTLAVDSVMGKLAYAFGKLEIIDTIRVQFEKTDLKFEGWCNLDSNYMNTRAYFYSEDIDALSDLSRISQLKGSLEGFLEATGNLGSPDLRGWLRGYDIGVSNLYFEDAIARFGLLNIQEKQFGDIYVEATNGTTFLLEDPIPLASLIFRFEGDTSIVRSLRVVGEDMNIEVQGKIIEFSDFYFDKIDAYGQGNTLQNIDPIHFSWNADTISLEEVRFSLNEGTVIVSGESINKKIQSAVMNVSGLNIDPFNAYLKGSEGIAGILEGLISYVDTSETPTVYSRMKVNNANLFGKQFNNVRFESRLIKNQIKLENILFEDNEKGYMNGYGTMNCHFPLTEGVAFIDSTDSLDIQLQFENFAFSTFSSFMLPKHSKDGKLFGSLSIANTMNAPEFNYQLKIMDPVLDRISGNELQIKGDYRDQKLEFTNITFRDDKGIATGSGYLPFTFALKPRLKIFNKDSSMYMNFSIHASALEFLSQYINSVESIEGVYDLAISISGTPNNPVRSGNVIAKDGIIHLTSLENPITGAVGSAILQNNKMEIISFDGYMLKPASRSRVDKFKHKLRAYTWDIFFPPVVSHDDPNVSITGDIDFTKFFKPVFNVQMNAKDLYMRTLLAEQEGLFNGAFTMTGGDTMNIEGEIDINEFIIRNEFQPSDPLIEELSVGKRYTNINLHAIIPGNLYFRNSQLDCELEGEMWIIKNGPEPYRFSGTLDIRKGKFSYYGWEFEIVRGSVIFDPTEFNPILDIEATVDLASYAQSDSLDTGSDEEDNVLVRLSGDLQNPTLEFESGKYSESDIIRFLTRTQLGEEDPLNQDRLSADAMNIIGMYFERQLEKNISRISGLDEFELRTRGNLLSNQQPDQWSFVLGQKIMPNLYLKYERALSLIEPNQQLGIEYRLSRNISLTGEVNQNGSYSINYLYKYRY